MRRILLTISLLMMMAAGCQTAGLGSFGRACTADAKMCWDGSYVGRSGPNCEFKACPDDTPRYKLPDSQACTEEARLCPDGSAVGRTGPNCSFAKCPGEK